MSKSNSQKKHGGVPEAPSGGYVDPMRRVNAREEERRLQERYAQMCGPVTSRRKEDE